MRKNLPVTQQEYVLPEGTSLVSKTDLKGRITYCNTSFVETSGFELHELMGAPHNLVRHPDMPEAAFADLWDTIKDGAPWTGLVKNRRKNGDHYWVCANVTPVKEAGQTVGYMSVRTKPSREEIAGAEALYARINEGRFKGMAVRQGFVRHTGFAGWFLHFGDLGLLTRIGIVCGVDAAILALLLVLLLSGVSTGWLVGTAAAGLVLGILTGVYLVRTVAGPVVEALEAARGIAAGQVTYRTRTRHTDELGLLLRSLQQVSVNLAAVVMDIKNGTTKIQHATGELTEEMKGLSSRTEQQAANLEQTAASMEELTSTVKQNADNAKQGNQLVQTASEVAARGGAVVGNVVTTMGSISESSKRIADIIGVIDGIAFQTNILALNAAVEAARAGEQGRGFAVVAAEVRSLAQRSASAAKEIKDLITDSVHKVEAGTALVNEAGATMNDVVSSVRRVTDIMSEITAASQEQAAGIDQVSQAVNQLDQITQQNAALVEEAAAATETMRGEAGMLDSAVEVFHIAGFTGARRAARPPAAVAAPTARAAATRPAPKSAPAARVAPKSAPKLTAKAKADDEWAEF